MIFLKKALFLLFIFSTESWGHSANKGIFDDPSESEEGIFFIDQPFRIGSSDYFQLRETPNKNKWTALNVALDDVNHWILQLLNNNSSYLQSNFMNPTIFTFKIFAIDDNTGGLINVVALAAEASYTSVTQILYLEVLDMNGSRHSLSTWNSQKNQQVKIIIGKNVIAENLEIFPDFSKQDIDERYAKSAEKIHKMNDLINQYTQSPGSMAQAVHVIKANFKDYF